MQAASCLAAPRKVDKKYQCFSALENIYIFTRLNIAISVSNWSLLHGAQPPSRLMATLSPWSALQTWTLIFLQWSHTIRLQPRRCPSLSPVRHWTRHLCCTHEEGPGRLCQASFRSRGRHTQAGKVWGRDLQQPPQQTSTQGPNG